MKKSIILSFLLASLLLASGTRKTKDQLDNAFCDNCGATFQDQQNFITTALYSTVNIQTGSTYTLLALDRGKLVINTNNDPTVAWTLPQGGTTGYDNGYFFTVYNRGTGDVVITPTSSTINGAANYTVSAGTAASIYCDGTNYFALTNSAGGTWGTITGTLANQSDLNSALAGKSPLAGSVNITTLGTITTGTFPWANLSGVPSTFTPSAHDHSGDTLLPGDVTITNTNPRFRLYESDGGVDEKYTTFGVDNQYGSLSIHNDSYSLANVVYRYKRTGYSIDYLAILPPLYLGGDAASDIWLKTNGDALELWRKDSGDKIDFVARGINASGVVDFSSASTTAPIKSGLNANRPATCTVGQFWFETDAAAGSNTYACTATDTWTLQSGGGGGAVSSVFSRTGAVVAVSGDYTAAQVTNTPAGNISATDAQAAINELDTEKLATTGNAATATALAANGANCAAGQAPLGVDASGVSEGCWTPTGSGDVSGPASSTLNTLALFDATTGKSIGEAVNCTYDATDDSITCTGGFKSGDGTTESKVILPELTANGSNDFRIVGAASMAVDGCIVVDGQPADNQILKATATTQTIDTKTCRVMAWEADAGSGGPVTEDTVLVGNGSTGVESTLPSCSGTTTDKLLYNSATNTFSCGTDQSGGATDTIANPVLIDEDFIVGPVAAPGNGAWDVVASSKSWLAGEANAPGIYSISTSTVTNNTAYTKARDATADPIAHGADFTMDCRVRFSATTNVAMMCGLQDNVTDMSSSPSDQIETRYNTTTDATFTYSVDSGPAVTISSGVTPVANTWYRFHTVRSGTTVTFSIYDSGGLLIAGSTKTMCPSGCDATATPPTSSSTSNAILGIETLAAVAVSIDVDLFRLEQTGLSR